MSSIFTRGWIALVILVATPLAGFAQRGGNDDTYSEDNYGDARSEPEPPRLLRGGLMHQLRSVTESVFGASEEKRPPTETNRNLPKPPPLASQNRSPAPSGRANAYDDSRGDERADAAPNRNWAGQFLVPNYRNRGQTPAARPQVPNERNGERRVYLGQRPSQRTASPNGQMKNSSVPSGSMPDDTDSRSSEPPNDAEDDAYPSGGLSLEASDASALNNGAAQAQEGPAEVVVSHVPDVPFVPRKAVPKRTQPSASGASSASGDAESAAAKTASKGPQAGQPTGNTTSSAKRAEQIDEHDAQSLTLQETASESPQLPGLTPSEPSTTESSAAKPSPAAVSPSVPSLEVTLLPGANTPSTREAVSSESSAAPALPTLPSAQLSSTPLDVPVSSSPSTPPAMPNLPSLSATTTSSQPTAKSPNPGLPASGLPTSSLPSSGLPAMGLSAAELSASQPAASSSAAPSLPNLGSAVSASAPVAAAQGSAQERLRMEIPHVVVQLLGPGDLATGTPTTYELVVQNPDRIDLSGLILRMETPPGVEIVQNPKWGEAVELEKAEDGATLLMWNVASIAAGGSTKLGLDLKASTSRNFAVAIEWTVLPQEGIDELTVKQADLQVALEGPVDVERDIANVYRVRVSNPGNAAARNVKVQVSAAAQPASQLDIGDLAAGQSEVVEMDLTFEKAGRLEIGAHALADGSLKRNTNIVVNVRQPVLQASLSMPESVLLGDNVFATMELRNTGDGPARKIQAGLMIPSETEVVNLPSGVSRQGDKLLWEVEIVPPGQVVTVPIELRLPKAGSHALKFACVTPSGALTSAEASTTVEAYADLKLLVNDPPTPAPIGAPVVYELTVTNRGSRDARNVTILAQFSEGIEPQSATGLKNRVVPGQVLFDSIPTIAAGETVKIKLTAKASVPGMHRFRAEVRCEENDARLVEEESTRYLESAARIAAPPSTLIQR